MHLLDVSEYLLLVVGRGKALRTRMRNVNDSTNAVFLTSSAAAHPEHLMGSIMLPELAIKLFVYIWVYLEHLKEAASFGNDVLRLLFVLIQMFVILANAV